MATPRQVNAYTKATYAKVKQRGARAAALTEAVDQVNAATENQCYANLAVYALSLDALGGMSIDTGSASRCWTALFRAGEFMEIQNALVDTVSGLVSIAIDPVSELTSVAGMLRCVQDPSIGADCAEIIGLIPIGKLRSLEKVLSYLPEGSIDELAGTTSRAADSAADLSRYDPAWASRQLAGQNIPGSAGWAVTPGGRTLSAHAAERTFLGGPGRAPIDPALIDDILSHGTQTAYRGLNNTIKVSAPSVCGRCYVVIDARDANHVVTVMVPK